MCSIFSPHNFINLGPRLQFHGTYPNEQGLAQDPYYVLVCDDPSGDAMPGVEIIQGLRGRGGIKASSAHQDPQDQQWQI